MKTTQHILKQLYNNNIPLKCITVNENDVIVDNGWHFIIIDTNIIKNFGVIGGEQHETTPENIKLLCDKLKKLEANIEKVK